MADRYPTTTTGRLEVARQHTHAAYSERNELLRLLACHYESHLMPIGGPMASLDKRAALCLHTDEGQLTFVVDATELGAFDGVPRLDDSHWDGATRLERTRRIVALVEALSGTTPWKQTKPTKTATAPRPARRRPRPRKARPVAE